MADVYQIKDYYRADQQLSDLCDEIEAYAVRLAESRGLSYSSVVIALDFARYRMMRDIDDGK